MAFFGYFAISRVVENFFPFSVLDMYSTADTETASRILARDASGHAYEVDHFDHWTCPAPLHPEARACADSGDVNTISYVDREAAIYLDHHRGRAGEGAPVDVVRRRWHLSDRAGPPSFDDCPLLHCQATRRP